MQHTGSDYQYYSFGELNDFDKKLMNNYGAVPHHCNDPKCPGNINRQKLELFDDMVKLLGSYTKYYCIDCSDRAECNERQSKCAEFTALHGIISHARGLQGEVADDE